MQNPTQNIYKKIDEFTKKISSNLDLKKDDFFLVNFTQISEVCDMPNGVPSVMLTPDDLALINNGIIDKNKHFKLIPTVVINDCFQFQSDLQLLGIISHELRHTWQYYNMYRAKEEFKVHTNPETPEYYNKQTEKDAYAFQLLVINTVSPSSTIDEIFTYFKNMKATLFRLNRNYKKKIKAKFKEWNYNE